MKKRGEGLSWPGLNSGDIRRIQDKAEKEADKRVKIREKNPEIIAEKKKQQEFTNAAEFSGSDVRKSSQAKYRRSRH